MKDLKNKKDKAVGVVKETIGKATKNEELELEGKIQSSKADIKEKSAEIKSNVADKINDIIDKKKNK